MSHSLEEALPLLTDAEASLRILIRRSLEHDQYGDVVRIAEVAASISSAIAILEATPSTPVEPRARESSGPRKKRSADLRQDPVSRPSSAGSAKGYPRFERHKDKIIKVGWSKQKRKEYVHRAPRSVISALARILRSRRAPGSRFMVAEILPLFSKVGAEAPSYQVYLALAWLQNVGVITGNGRGGYLADSGGISDANLETLWQSLPEQA